MIIGYILTNTKIDIDSKFKLINDLDEIVLDLPTLVVGWDIVKTINPNVDFIDKKLSDNIYWTFKKTERRDLFNMDLYNFTELCYKKLIDSIEYVYVDFILDSRETIKSIFNEIRKSKDSKAFTINNMVYINVGNKIYGIDINILKYLDLDYQAILDKIKLYSTSFLVDNDILIKYKDILDNINNEVKYIPYLYSIDYE
jgi:hypothetical protein